MELVDVLCVNEVEACALAETETFEADAVLTLLHEKYPQTRLLLTAGSAGSYYWMQSGGCLSLRKGAGRGYYSCRGHLQRLFSGGPLQRQFSRGRYAACYQSSRNCRAAQRCSGIHPGNQRVEMNDTEGHVDILVCMAAPAARVLAQQVICAAATRICKWFWCSPIRTPA